MKRTVFSADQGGLPVIAKPPSLARRILLGAAMVLGVGGLIFAAAGGGEDGRLSGAGSTFVSPMMQRASTAFQSYRAADRVDAARQEGQGADWSANAAGVDYDPVGSVGGLVRLADPNVSFAATEVPLSTGELQSRGLAQFPILLGAAAPVTNLALGGLALTLDAPTLAAIYTGKVTDWSDPAIAALNPGLPLSPQPISVVHRSDGSGTTHTFTGYLATSDAWTAGQSPSPEWPVGSGAQGSEGMIAAIKGTPGSIGYVEIGQARRALLDPVRLVNAAGETVEVSGGGVLAAAQGVTWRAEDGFVAPLGASSNATAWPMAATVHAVLRREGAQRDTARTLAFFRFFLAEAARSADSLGYVPLPPEAVGAIEAYWANAFDLTD